MPKPSGEDGALSAFIDQGSSFEGKLSFNDTVRIDGQFTGEITSENTLIVGEPGEIQANIRSQTVIVSGEVNGDVVATRQLILHKTARLEGNVETPSVVMEEGALFNGKLTMSSGGRSRDGASAEPVAEKSKPAGNHEGSSE